MMNFDTSRGKSYGVAHLLAAFSGPLEDILQKQLELSASRASFLRQFGAVYLDGRRCLENVQVPHQAYIRVHQNPRRFPVEALQWPQQKVFEDDNLIVINKPSGLPVPATVDNIRENVAALLSDKLNTEIFVTHRLDMGTSGLLILAKNKMAQAHINQKLMQGEVQKFYRALVHGRGLALGEWLHYMEPSPRAPKKVSLEARAGWIPCRLRILDQLEVAPDHSEVVIELLTGRTHQIRAQLSASGHPIVGDQAYGSPCRIASHEEIALQAFSLSFPSLENEKMSFQLVQSPWSLSSSLAPLAGRPDL